MLGTLNRRVESPHAGTRNSQISPRGAKSEKGSGINKLLAMIRTIFSLSFRLLSLRNRVKLFLAEHQLGQNRQMSPWQFCMASSHLNLPSDAKLPVLGGISTNFMAHFTTDFG
jgi:hypothetical protein